MIKTLFHLLLLLPVVLLIYGCKKDKAAGYFEDGPYSLDIYPGYVRAYVHTATDDFFEVKGTTKIMKEVWQHVAATFTGDQLTVYYNGKTEAGKAVNGPLKVTKGDLAIGTHEVHYPIGNFRGKLDNMKIYDKALSADQIMHLYQKYKQ